MRAARKEPTSASNSVWAFCHRRLACLSLRWPAADNSRINYVEFEEILAGILREPRR
jgi:hypothetical protein